MRFALPALVLVLAVLLLSIGCTTNPVTPQSSVPVLNATTAGNLSTGHTTAQMVTFVHGAAAYARIHGRDAALAEFMNRSGPFFDGDLYIYAYNFDGLTLAHPIQPEFIGRNRFNETDFRGNYTLRGVLNAARNGSGFDRFWFVNPDHGNATEAKLAYAERVDDDWFLGSGVYQTVDPDPVEGTVSLVEEAVRFAKTNGREQALAAFNNQNSSFVRGDRYIFAYDLNGTVLALPAESASVGTSQWNLVDPNGIQMVRQMREAALGGGGFVTYTTSHRMNLVGEWEKHVYVAMAGDDWFVGSGTYT